MTMREWLAKVEFTAFFLVWEAQKRVSGAWRRREWRKLGRYGMYFFAAFSLISGGAALIFFW